MYSKPLNGETYRSENYASVPVSGPGAPGSELRGMRLLKVSRHSTVLVPAKFLAEDLKI